MAIRQDSAQCSRIYFKEKIVSRGRKRFHFDFHVVPVRLHTNTVVVLIFSWSDNDGESVMWCDQWKSVGSSLHCWAAASMFFQVHFQPGAACRLQSWWWSTCTTGLEQHNRHNSHYTRLHSIRRRPFTSLRCVVCSVANGCQYWLQVLHLCTDETETHVLVCSLHGGDFWTCCSSFLQLLHLVTASLADVAEWVWLTPETATCWINNLQVLVWDQEEIFSWWFRLSINHHQPP